MTFAVFAAGADAKIIATVLSETMDPVRAAGAPVHCTESLKK